jgi:hypothetical protein
MSNIDESQDTNENNGINVERMATEPDIGSSDTVCERFSLMRRQRSCNGCRQPSRQSTPAYLGNFLHKSARQTYVEEIPAVSLMRK